MYKKLKIPFFIFIVTSITAIIYLYPFISFQKLATNNLVSYTIPILKINNTTSTLIPFYNDNPNEFLIRTSEKALFNQYTRSFDILFLNEPTEPISYAVIPLQTDHLKNIVVGVVNDKTISELHYYDHVGANGIISFLIDNSLNNNGFSAIEQYPQFFVIKTPFKHGTLIGKHADGAEQINKTIILQ